MGAWGVALFSDDLAADVRDDFRDLIGQGLSSGQAVDRLKLDYAETLDDSDEAPVFWIALAVTQWDLGRVDADTKREALRWIDSGKNLERWPEKQKKKREEVLDKAKQKLLSDPPAAKRVALEKKESNDWDVGEVLGLKLLSEKWVLIRVVGHHTDNGGRSAVCELLDWVGATLPSAQEVAGVGLRNAMAAHQRCPFLFEQPKKKADQQRLARTGIQSKPQQKPDGFTAFPWKFVDRLLLDVYGVT